MPRLIVYASAGAYRSGNAAAAIDWEPGPDGQSPLVLELLREHGMILSAPCGGSRRCGLCAVWLSGEADEPSAGELATLPETVRSEEPPGISFRLRLACAARPLGNCELCFTGYNSPFTDIGDPDAYLSGDIRAEEGGGHNPVENNTAFPHFSTDYPQSAEHNPVVNNSAFPHVPTSYPQPVDNNPGTDGLCASIGYGKLPDGNYGAAFDLGTTTVSLRVCRGSVPVYEKTELNAQRVFGADVISRISYGSTPEGLHTLQTAAASQLIRMLDDAGEKLGTPLYGHGYIPVAGNTAMLYLLCGICPEELGRYPYIPSERFGRGETIICGGKCFDAYLPCCSGGFTGGDLTCCLTAVEAVRRSRSNRGSGTVSRLSSVLPEGIEQYGCLMLCDLGTNGEIALLSGGDIFVTSAAAGPALEGGNISCGSGAVTGAVSHIFRLPGENGLRLGCDVIGGGEALTLSGCALTELSAILLDCGIIDETGRMLCGTYRVRDRISVTQADIRQLQLAKGAVRAAAEMLLEQAGAGSPDAIIITGGLGYRMDAYAARRTGLLPACGDIFFTPALAMEGAVLCLGERGRTLSEETAGRCRCVELSGDSDFDRLFIEYMEFPTNDNQY